MDDTKQLKDWTFRYQYIYRQRRTKKQKQRFISALAMDISEKRQDIQVIEYKQDKKYMASNLYVGNIEQADRVICTYYDTPSLSIGNLDLFDRNKQRKGVTSFILLTSIISLLIGVGLTLLYINNTKEPFSFSSLNTIVIIASYTLYFFMLSKVSKGLSSRHNLIRNTSSVLSLLMLIAKVKDQKVAFAFVDEGCVGDQGIERLKDSCKKSVKIYGLDCVGANAPLHYVGNDFDYEFSKKGEAGKKINRIFAAEKKIADDSKVSYVLPKELLKSKTVNKDNLVKIMNLFS